MVKINVVRVLHFRVGKLFRNRQRSMKSDGFDALFVKLNDFHNDSSHFNADIVFGYRLQLF